MPVGPHGQGGRGRLSQGSPLATLPSPSLLGNSGLLARALAFLRAARHPRSAWLPRIEARVGRRTDVIVSGEPNPRGESAGARARSS